MSCLTKHHVLHGFQCMVFSAPLKTMVQGTISHFYSLYFDDIIPLLNLLTSHSISNGFSIVSSKMEMQNSKSSKEIVFNSQLFLHSVDFNIIYIIKIFNNIKTSFSLPIFNLRGFSKFVENLLLLS